MKNSENILKGRRNKAAGESFERSIEFACMRYRIAGIADIDKTPEPMRPIRRNRSGEFIAVYTKKAQPDFSGILKGGRAIRFEAKRTESPKFPQTRVTDEQSRRLTMTDNLGGIAFVLLEFGQSGHVYRMPWQTWNHMSEIFGRAYIKESDLTPDMRINNSHGFPMFLSAKETGEAE